MAKRYYIAELDEVFTSFFMNYITQKGEEGLEKKDLIQVMAQVEAFEDRNKVEFVSIMQEGFMLFRKK